MAPKITIFHRCQRQNNCDLEKWVNMGLPHLVFLVAQALIKQLVNNSVWDYLELRSY